MVEIPLARPQVGDLEIEQVEQVIRSGWLTQGPVVAEFEEVVATYCQAPNAVAVSSCTTALHLSLLASGIGPGDEVIVPSMSFIATAAAVVHSGATPVFAEVLPDTFNLDLDHAAHLITERTRAIVLVHQLGLPADLDAAETFAERHRLTIVEDAACALGSRYKGRPIGSSENLVCFSFHPRKVITTGDGGMALTRSAEQAERLRRLRQHGMSVSDSVRHSASKVVFETFEEVGFNYRLTDLQAAVGVAQMRRLPSLLEARRALADGYTTAFAQWSAIETPVIPDYAGWNAQTYAVRLGCDGPTRDMIIQSMRSAGIAAKRGVMTIHREPAFEGLPVSLPVSEAASDGSLMLPLFESMTESEQQRVVEGLVSGMRTADVDPGA